MVQFQQHFLCRTIAGRSFESGKHTLLGFVFLACGKIRLREMEIRAGLVQRTGRHDCSVLADRAAILLLRVQQIAETAMQFLILDGIDVVHALKRGCRLGLPSSVRFEQCESLQREEYEVLEVSLWLIL